MGKREPSLLPGDGGSGIWNYRIRSFSLGKGVCLLGGTTPSLRHYPSRLSASHFRARDRPSGGFDEARQPSNRQKCIKPNPGYFGMFGRDSLCLPVRVLSDVTFQPAGSICWVNLLSPCHRPRFGCNELPSTAQCLFVTAAFTGRVSHISLTVPQDLMLSLMLTPLLSPC